MKNFILLTAAAALIFVVANGASALSGRATARADVCSDVEPIDNNGLWKWKASNHINPNDPRADGPSLICNTRNRHCVEWPAKVYHCNGDSVRRGLMRKYGTWNVNGADRGYTRNGRSNAMRREARRLDCSTLLVQKERQREGDPAVPCYSVSVDSERSGSPL